LIRDLDDTVQALLKQKAEPGSELEQAEVSFDLPDADWRAQLQDLTVNCYLYDVRENRDLRTHEPILQRNADGTRAARLRPPARIDCAYCITAWSPATQESVKEEHRLLSQVLKVLLLHPTIPEKVLQGKLKKQIPPYPTVIAAPDGVKNQPEFWGALDQQLKPSLNYVVTLAVMLDEPPSEMPPVVEEVAVEGQPLPAILSIDPCSGERGQTLDVVLTGMGTRFGSSSVVSLSPPEGIVVNSTAADKPTRLAANVTIDAAAPEGKRTVMVTAGSQVVTREDGFEVT
jgi:hypothetical protein